jgi:hypothetical protein
MRTLVGTHDVDSSVHLVGGARNPGYIALACLALGPGFIPDQRLSQCLNESGVRAAFHDMAWRLWWRWEYRNHPDRPAPRFYVRKTEAMLKWRRRYPHPCFHQMFSCLERWFSARVLFARHRFYTAPRTLPVAAWRALRDLRGSPDYVVRLADKNMGICLVSRPWYIDMCLRHLLSPRDFCGVSQDDAQELMVHFRVRRDALIAHLRSWLGRTVQEGKRFTEYEQYISSHATDACTVPTFYGLIKVHKNPVALRPIVACHSWLTTPVSQVCAHELHALVRRHLPHVLEDSKALVRQITDVRVPLHHSVDSVVFITGDVEGLYVNIPITDAIAACVTFVTLHEGPALAALIRAWLKFVFECALVRFGERIFLQQWGFAMGTAVSPDAANVYMAVCEDLRGVYGAASVASTVRGDLLLFARLIDDYTIVLSGVDDAAVAATLAALDARAAPHLRITWVASRRAMDTLDLHVFKGDDFVRSRQLSYRTHQKRGNRYSYLPFESRHPPAVSRSVVKSEVVRNAVNCSSFADFRHMVQLYMIRQLSRGFPPDLLYKWVAEVGYDVRERVICPTPHVASSAGHRVPLYLKLQYDEISAQLSAPYLLHAGQAFCLTRSVNFWDRMLVCWTRARSLGSVVMSSADASAAAERETTPNP